MMKFFLLEFVLDFLKLLKEGHYLKFYLIHESKIVKTTLNSQMMRNSRSHISVIVKSKESIMSDIDFMGYKCTFHVDTDSKIHYEHNIRDPKLVKHEKHIDPTKKSEVQRLCNRTCRIWSDARTCSWFQP